MGIGISQAWWSLVQNGFRKAICRMIKPVQKSKVDIVIKFSISQDGHAVPPLVLEDTRDFSLDTG